MQQSTREDFSRRSFTSLKPKPISLSTRALTQTAVIDPEKGLPLVVEANVAGLDLAEWAAKLLPYLDTQLLKTGGILFRNFNLILAVGVGNGSSSGCCKHADKLNRESAGTVINCTPDFILPKYRR